MAQGLGVNSLCPWPEPLFWTKMCAKHWDQVNPQPVPQESYGGNGSGNASLPPSVNEEARPGRHYCCGRGAQGSPRGLPRGSGPRMGLGGKLHRVDLDGRSLHCPQRSLW